MATKISSPRKIDFVCFGLSEMHVPASDGRWFTHVQAPVRPGCPDRRAQSPPDHCHAHDGTGAPTLPRSATIPALSTRTFVGISGYGEYLLYHPVMLSHFSPAPVKTDRAVRIQ